MKSKMLICFMIIITFAFSACSPQSSNILKSNDSTASKIDKATEEENSVVIYGSIQTPFSNFKITPDINSNSYPTIYYKDGKAGFKDKNGNVITEAIYEKVNEFWNGIGSVRFGENGQYIWKCIDINGNFYDYDEVYGFQFGVSQVLKNGKYGFINTAGDLVVPLIYDELFCSYTENARSTYAIRDGKFVYLNLSDGYEEDFEMYNPNRRTQYKRTIDIKDYNIVVINGMLLINGEYEFGSTFPITILQGLDFDLFFQNKQLGTYKASMVGGDYEGEIDIAFPEYEKALTTDSPECYYAILSNSNIKFSKVTKPDKTDKFLETAKQYLKDFNIENTPFSIGKAFEGDLIQYGKTGAVIEINDTYRNTEMPEPIAKQWTEKKFSDDKTAFANAILYIPDVNKPIEYKVIKSNIWTHIYVDYLTHDIEFIANLDNDNQLEVLISNIYYEEGQYSVVDLK